jgi:hypothetical protein
VNIGICQTKTSNASDMMRLVKALKPDKPFSENKKLSKNIPYVMRVRRNKQKEQNPSGKTATFSPAFLRNRAGVRHLIF